MCKCKLWLQESRDSVFCILCLPCSVFCACEITNCYRAQTHGDDDDDNTDDDDHGGDDENGDN